MDDVFKLIPLHAYPVFSSPITFNRLSFIRSTHEFFYLLSQSNLKPELRGFSVQIALEALLNGGGDSEPDGREGGGASWHAPINTCTGSKVACV